MPVAIAETIKGMRFIHPETNPISVSDELAAWAAISVPGPMDPHGPIISPSRVSNAARDGVNIKDNSRGNPMSTETPNPVTVSRNGTTPWVINMAEATVGPSADSQPASRRWAPVRSITPESSTPPPMIARTLMSVQNVPFQSLTSDWTGAAKYVTATTPAARVPSNGGSAAEMRGSANSPRVSRTGSTAMDNPTLRLLQMKTFCARVFSHKALA